MTRVLILVSILIAAASCSTIKVSSDFDRTAGFASYKTYAFTSEAQNLPLDDINRNRVLNAIESELALKGFTKTSATPDVLIDVNIKAVQQTTATASTTGTGGYYGRGYRYGYGGGFSTTTINYDTYTDGTMFIDMIDAKKQQLVWQGRGTKTLDPEASQQKREENINYAVKEIFKKYPPQL
jgi:hypothetical protein